MPEFFRALEVARTQALVCLDMERVNAPHAPEYHPITPSGKLFTRERCVCAIAAQTFYAEWDLGDVSVRVSPAW